MKKHLEKFTSFKLLLENNNSDIIKSMEKELEWMASPEIHKATQRDIGSYELGIKNIDNVYTMTVMAGAPLNSEIKDAAKKSGAKHCKILLKLNWGDDHEYFFEIFK